MRQTFFLLFIIFLGHFLPFYHPSNDTKNQNFEEKKCLEILSFPIYMFTINDNHMMYDSWDMERNRQNFLSFWAIYYLFTTPSLMILNIKILKKKWKKVIGGTILLYIHGYHKWRSYDIWFLKYKVWQTNFFYFGTFFALFLP